MAIRDQCARNERRVHLFDELLGVVCEAAAGRAQGPVFLSRCYASGKERPPLAGKDLDGLVAELGCRIAAAAPEGDRTLETKLAHGLWRDMGALTPKRIRREFIRVAKKIGRADLTCPKIFRHGMATAMQAAGVDPFVRKQIIGHTRLETTAIYTHTADDTLSREMERTARTRLRSLSLARELEPGEGLDLSSNKFHLSSLVDDLEFGRIAE